MEARPPTQYHPILRILYFVFIWGPSAIISAIMWLSAQFPLFAGVNVLLALVGVGAFSSGFDDVFPLLEEFAPVMMCSRRQ